MSKGFTLIELLIVIGIIAVLIGVFVTTVNLGRPFEQARDSQRYSNVSAIAGAMKARMADNRGVWTTNANCPAIGTSPAFIVASTSDFVGPAQSGAGYVNLQNCLVDDYMLVIPQDPSLDTASNSVGVTGYQVSITSNRVTVSAPFYEAAPAPGISITN